MTAAAGVAVAAALGSALLVAVASVLQHRAGTTDAEPSLRKALRHPLWTVGAVAGVSGFLLHVVALSHGALSVVQPLLVSGLLFAVPMSRALEHRAIRAVDIGAAAAVVAGLVVFQSAAHASTGTTVADLTALGWCVGVAAVVLAVVLLLAARRPDDRALWLGLAAGAGYGLVAALLKTTVGDFDSHGIAVLRTWPVYAFAVVVAGSIAVNQLAFSAGPLARSLPLITIADPIVAIVVGAVAFGETISGNPLLVTAQVAGFAVMSAGVVVLARQNAAAPQAAVQVSVE